MTPADKFKRAARAAFRRRYGYAALRILRRGWRSAFAEHLRRSLGAAGYDGTRSYEALARLHTRAYRKLTQRWPSLSFFDDRAAP